MTDPYDVDRPWYPGARLVAAHEAPVLLGIPAATVRKWASRGHVQPAATDRWGRPLYAAPDLLARRVA